jgi:hypothetical protein
MIAALILSVTWAVVALTLAIVIGKGIDIADREQEKPVVLPEWMTWDDTWRDEQ